MSQFEESIGATLWEEAEPIIRHAVVVLVLEASFLVIGLCTRLLGFLFPEQRIYLHIIELVDIWLALALLSLFGVFTLLQVALRLYRSLKSEWIRS